MFVGNSFILKHGLQFYQLKNIQQSFIYDAMRNENFNLKILSDTV